MRRRIIRKATTADALSMFVEQAAAGLLWTWAGFRDATWGTRRFWAGIGRMYGERIDTKVREAFPGCRAGWRYAVGQYPPVPLLEPLPAGHLGEREHLDVEGVKHWHVGQPWQRCQAEHLRELGEIDGQEWRAYVRWRDAGFPARYVLDDDDTRTACGCIVHGCW